MADLNPDNQSQEPQAPVITSPEPTKEFNINKPTPFNGDRKKVIQFIQDCKVYLAINRHIYTTDEAKVAFVISYMNEGEAQLWKTIYIANMMDDEGNLKFPTFKTLMTDIHDGFMPTSQTQDAIHQLALLKQGKKTAEEIITEFRLLVGQAGFKAETTSDHLHLIEKLQGVLNISLVKKILLTDTPPTTINDWARKAIQFDNQYRMMMEVLNRRAGEGKPKNDKNDKKTGKPNWMSFYQKKERDPDAMDVDAISIDKRTECMKKGLCFKCERPGNLARDHDEWEKQQKKGKGKTQGNVSSPQNRSMKEIHALLSSLSEKEAKELCTLQAAEKKKQEKEEKEDDDEDF